jgi:parallel beta-helix repeat protein
LLDHQKVREIIMNKMLAIPFALSMVFAKTASAADEIHWTVTEPSTVTINWHGSSTENSVVYGLPKSAVAKVNARHPVPLPFTSQGTFWEAKLTGLKANTTYTYQIGANAPHTFKTAPAPGASGFTVYAQSSIGDSKHFPLVSQVQKMIADGKPDFVFGVGDLSMGSWLGQGAVHQHFNDVMVWSNSAGYMPVWGDLDVLNNSKDNFGNNKGRFALPNPQTSPGTKLVGGGEWYWFDYGNTRFITLPEPTPTALSDWQKKASSLMAQAQGSASVKFIVTTVHRSAYSSGHYAGSAVLAGMLDALGDKYGKYVLNIGSHSVNYERTHPQHGVVHVTAGVGGRNLLQDGSCLWRVCTKPAWSAYRAMRLGTLRLSFTDSGINGAFACGPAGGGVNDVKCKKGDIIDTFTVAPRTALKSASSQLPVAAAAISAVPVALQATSCTKIALPVTNLIKDGGYAYRINKTFGTSADNLSNWTRSKIRVFENNVEIGPGHSGHDLIRSSGGGRYSHWIMTSGSGESLRFSATNNSNPATNGRSYSYCIQGASSTPTTPADTSAPSLPGGMAATVVSSSQIKLSWSASSDNKGVTGYKIYRNGTLLTSTSATTYQATGLVAATTYSFYVVASDAAGNNSAKSTTVSAKTAAATSAAPPPTACASSPTSSLVVNVQDKGARGNGSANDTAAIQSAIDQVGGSGGTVYVPAGTYMIDTYRKLMMKSNMTFRMAPGAVLKAIPNNYGVYNIIRIMSVSRVNIVGGTLIGDRFSHGGSSGEHGHGLEVYAANNIVVEGVTAKEAWGDGFYIGFNSSNVAICSVTADSNRRHGITVTSGNGITIKNSVAKNSNGFYYSSGMDVETNAGEYISNVNVSNNQMFDNNACGISSGAPHGGAVSGLVVSGNTLTNNGKPGTAAYSGIVLSTVSGAKILNNIVKNSAKDGITLVDKSNNNTVTGNTVTGSGVGNSVDRYVGNGILMWDNSRGNTVTNNTLTGNKINLYDGVGGNVISPNTLN